MNIKPASSIGFNPSPFIFSKLVSTPNANIAIVSKNTSNSIKNDFTGSGTMFKEFKPHTATKRTANTGIGIFSHFVPDFLERYNPSKNK